MTKKFDEIDINTKKSLKEIYTKIFCRIEEQYIIVFLCGGASTIICNIGKSVYI